MAKKILLIEDDFFIRNLVRDTFWVHGGRKYQILEAKDIEEGEKILAAEKPDLIFLDLMFSKDGLTTKPSLNFLEKLKSNPKTKDIKVIIYSGYPDFKKRCLELGAEEFLIKGEKLPKEIFEIAQKIISKKID